MFVVDDTGPKAALGAQDDFAPTTAQGLNHFQNQIDPIFRVGYILAGAHLQCLLSSIRFTIRTTGRLASAQVKLLSQVQPSEPQGLPQHLRIVVDEARSSLGEIAEMASQEFCQLQDQLKKMQESTRRLVPEPSASERPYERRWKAKS